MPMRDGIRGVVAWVGLCASAACGGGSHVETSFVSVQGVVAARDGATSDLGGVRVVLLETGESKTTAADGSFSFSVASGSDAHLRFVDPLAAVHATRAAVAPEDCPLPDGGDGTPWPDSEGIDGDEVRLDAVDASIGVEVEIDEGVVTSLKTTRGADTAAPEEQGTVAMTNVDGGLATATLSLHHVDVGGFAVRIEAHGLPPSAILEFELDDAHGLRSDGSFPTSDCGASRLVMAFGYDEDGEDDPTGWTVHLRTADGVDIVVGVVPAAGTEIVF